MIGAGFWNGTTRHSSPGRSAKHGVLHWSPDPPGDLVFFFVALQDTKLHWTRKVLFSLTPFALGYFMGFYGLLFSGLIVGSIFKASG